jgi:hypothetical protein
MSRLAAQQARVALRAREVVDARRAATAARHWLVYAIRRRIGSPAGLAAAFAAGFICAASGPGSPAERQPRMQQARRLLAIASWALRQWARMA